MLPQWNRGAAKFKLDILGENSYIRYEAEIWKQGCLSTPANIKASDELWTFLVLKEAGRTISIFRLVFVTVRCGAGFPFVTHHYSGRGSTLCRCSPRMTRGPGRAMGLGRYFTFPANCLDRPPSSHPPLLPLCGPPLIPTGDILWLNKWQVEI